MVLESLDVGRVDGRRIRRKIHNVEAVDHACFQRRLQAAANQLRHSLADGDIAGSGICLRRFQNIVIDTQCGSHARIVS